MRDFTVLTHFDNVHVSFHVQHNINEAVIMELDFSCRTSCLLDSPKDIYVDDMGSWKYNGVYRTWVNIELDGFMVTRRKSKPSQDEDDSLYHPEKIYFVHETSTNLKKTIAVISGMFSCNFASL